VKNRIRANAGNRKYSGPEVGLWCFQPHETQNLGNTVPGLFTPVLAKQAKWFSLIDCISVGVDRMQRNFDPMRRQVEAWQRSELTDVTAKVVIYEAFVEGKLEAPKHLAHTVHDVYFEPKYEEFRSRTIWSLSNAFTSAFKELASIPQFRATAKLDEFLEAGSPPSDKGIRRYQCRGMGRAFGNRNKMTSADCPPPSERILRSAVSLLPPHI
jgi:hypothetical protein